MYMYNVHRPNIFQHAAISQLQAFRGTISKLKGPKFETFAGSIPQDPYRSSLLCMINSFPSLTKTPV